MKKDLSHENNSLAFTARSGLLLVAISTFGFIPPWIFLNNPSGLAALTGTDWSQAVGYGGWFLVASIVGRVALTRLNPSSIKRHVSLGAISIIVSGLIILILPEPLGPALAILLTASINGSILFGPFIASAFRAFPNSPSIAVAFATVGQLTAAATSNALFSIASKIGPNAPVGTTFLIAGCLLLGLAKLLVPAQALPSLAREQNAGWLPGAAMSLCGFCVTSSGTIFIFFMPNMIDSGAQAGIVLAVFSASALGGRVCFAVLQDYTRAPMHIVSSGSMLASCAIAAVPDGSQDFYFYIAIILFGVGYGGITPTYLSKQKELFSGEAASKQNLNFFILASCGILFGSTAKIAFSASSITFIPLCLAALNFILILWISSVKTSVYASASAEDFER